MPLSLIFFRLPCATHTYTQREKESNGVRDIMSKHDCSLILEIYPIYYI